MGKKVKQQQATKTEQCIALLNTMNENEHVAVAKYIMYRLGVTMFTESEVVQMVSDASKPKAEPVINGVVRLK